MNSDLFSSECIRASCVRGGRNVAVEVVAETGSTNADLLRRVGLLEAPLLLVAARQTAGRGRAGRTWHAQEGASLTFSLAWRFALPLNGLAALPLAVGVAVCETLRDCGMDAALKWPNDILREGRKLGGVLIEAARAGEAAWAVIGIGINLELSAALAGRIDAPAAALDTGLERNVLMARLLDALCDCAAEFERSGFGVFRERWNRLHAYTNLAVVVLDRGHVLHEGTAAGVDGDGRLLIDTASGRAAVIAGDVSLRLNGDGMRRPGE